MTHSADTKPGRDTPRGCVFLDRDGVIMREVGYCDHSDRVELLAGAGAALARLNAAGLLAIVVTNQSGVARGMFDEAMLGPIHERLAELLAGEGGRIDAIYYAPQHRSSADPRYRDDPEQMRKPGVGMIRRAQADFAIDMTRAWVIGDKPADIELAANAGVPGILVRTGYGQGEIERRHLWKVEPAAIAADIGEAVDWILSR